MPSTYIKLASTTVGAGGAATITFSSIPQTYTDLVVKVSARDGSATVSNNILIRPNGATTSLSVRYILGNGSTVSSVNDTPLYTAGAVGANATSSTFSNVEMYIPNYTSSNNKSISIDAVTENNATSANAQLSAGLWSSSTAISSIDIVLNGGGNFSQHTTATLYGVLKYAETGTGSKAIGGTVTTSGGYTYHTFFGSGMFTPTTSFTADFLVVAGGGGGGWDTGGGGGAGGLRSSVGSTGGGGSLESALSLTAQSYAVIVGAGGAGPLNSSAAGSNGTNSVFSTITSTGGGGGATNSLGSGAGSTGGSGGGGSAWGAVPSGAGGSGTANQGYAGGAGANSNSGGGGGGAGAVGAGGSTSSGGNGVICSNFANATSTGVSTYYAGGGGGGGVQASSGGKSGGFGGGGAGGSATISTIGLPGVANTGGGGGGGSDGGGSSTRAGGNGGSGIVIIRYTT